MGAGSDVELMKYLFAQEHKRIGRGEHHIFTNSANKTHYWVKKVQDSPRTKLAPFHKSSKKYVSFMQRIFF